MGNETKKTESTWKTPNTGIKFGFIQLPMGDVFMCVWVCICAIAIKRFLIEVKIEQNSWF